jgi:DNA-binding NarL/FixJ family response regulator
MAVRILLADDHEIVLEGIRILLARLRPEWEICGASLMVLIRPLG